MENIVKILEEKLKEYEELETEYLDFKETSRLIEDEYESKIKELSRNNENLFKENCKRKNEAEISKREIEKIITKLTEQEKTINSQESEIKYMREKIIGLENFNEDCLFQKRITENIINDLEEKINNLLEKLALMQTEFELNQNLSSEQTQLLQDQLKETEFQIQILNVKNGKTNQNFFLNQTKISHCKLQLTKKAQSNHCEVNKNNKKEVISPNLISEMTFKNKLNSLQKENISVATLLANKGKSHKSFHNKTTIEKNCSNNIEVRPPLKFGLSTIKIKNFLKKNMQTVEN